MFETEAFVAACRAGLREERGPRAVREVVARAVSDPASMLRTLGEPQRAGASILYAGDDMTIVNLVWGADMHVSPHDHRTWAVIGIYTGREDNIFWRRRPDGRVEAAGARSLGACDVCPMGDDIIHSVLNPLPRLTGAIHIYGGDFLHAPRSTWDAETLAERPYDTDRLMAAFDEANRRMGIV
jgi:predicted metal-dependent enzyme (double-stranded beta helix superfamily)